MQITSNALYCADCLDLLERLDSDQVQLIYLDPLYGIEPAAGFEVFPRAEGNSDYALFLSRLLQQCKRILRPEGTLFAHLRPGLPADLLYILEQVFGKDGQRKEYIWLRRGRFHSLGSQVGHDKIWLYAKTDAFVYHPPMRPRSREELRRFSQNDNGGSYYLDTLTAQRNRQDFTFDWQGYVPPRGRSWRFSLEELDDLYVRGRIHFAAGQFPQLKVYLVPGENSEVEAGDTWNDIPVFVLSRENQRYSGQKPLALLERIVEIGSNSEDIVLDPFCGSGTALVAAHLHGRKWVGCDIASEAQSICTKRMLADCHLEPSKDYDVVSAETLKAIPVVCDQYNVSIVAFDDPSRPLNILFVEGTQVPLEESYSLEFKEVKSDNAPEAILREVVQNAVAFLNNVGGRVLWGIQDNGVVVGVRLSYEERNAVARKMSARLSAIQPPVDPTQFPVEFHQVRDREYKPTKDLYVVELVVPCGAHTGPYRPRGGSMLVRLFAANQKLDEIQEKIWTKRRKRSL